MSWHRGGFYTLVVSAPLWGWPSGDALALAAGGVRDATSRVVGGELSKTCAWPSTVSVGGCTGTLVHPKLVVYAAHCGSRVSEVRFGEKRPFARRVPTKTCKIYPGGTKPELGGNHRDYAFCVLAEEVNDVPIIPILYGCETETIKVGKKAFMVGFGATGTKANNPGTQRELEVTIDRIDAKNGKLSVNGNGEGKGCCYGDSGGPLFVRLDESLDPEQGWRLVGVTSYGDDEPECTGQGWFGMMHDQEAVPWIEEKSGIDITPCHDVDGSWNPSEDCGRFPLKPGIPASGWDKGCGGGPLSKMSSTCGPAFGEDKDKDSGDSSGEKDGGDQDSDPKDSGAEDSSSGSSSGEKSGGEDKESDSSKAPEGGTAEESEASSDEEDDGGDQQDKKANSAARGCRLGAASSLPGGTELGVLLWLCLCARRRKTL